MEMQITPLQEKERLYVYANSRQINGQTGFIGHLRADFGSSGRQFYSTFFDANQELKTEEFKQDLDAVINSMREDTCYVDRDGNEIREHDILNFEDGTTSEVFRLEDGTLGISASNPDYLKAHPHSDECFQTLQAMNVSPGIMRVAKAAIDPQRSPAQMEGRSRPTGMILRSRTAMQMFCNTHSDTGIPGNYCMEYGIRVNTKNHAFLLRMNPNQGDYNLYCFCYQREWLDKHIHRAEKGIRFITPSYKELFRVADGDKVRIVDGNGESRDRTVRFIDDYHMELDGSVGGNLYHICEFAERMETNGCQQIIPLRKSLPDQCYSMLLDTGKIVILKKGETGYYPTDIPFASKEEAREIVDYQNSKLGVTRAQEEAMKAGSMFGYAVPAADPKNYNENGLPIRQKAKERDER